MKLLQITTEKVETLEAHSPKGKLYKKPRKKTEYQKKEYPANLPVETIYSALTESNIEKKHWKNRNVRSCPNNGR